MLILENLLIRSDLLLQQSKSLLIVFAANHPEAVPICHYLIADIDALANEIQLTLAAVRRVRLQSLKAATPVIRSADD